MLRILNNQPIPRPTSNKINQLCLDTRMIIVPNLSILKDIEIFMITGTASNVIQALKYVKCEQVCIIGQMDDVEELCQIVKFVYCIPLHDIKSIQNFDNVIYSLEYTAPLDVHKLILGNASQLRIVRMRPYYANYISGRTIGTLILILKKPLDIVYATKLLLKCRYIRMLTVHCDGIMGRHINIQQIIRALKLIKVTSITLRNCSCDLEPLLLNSCLRSIKTINSKILELLYRNPNITVDLSQN